MLLLSESAESFCQGVCSYMYQPAVEGAPGNRIFVPVEIAGKRYYAAVDTGGVYLVCGPEVADLLNLDPNQGAEVPPMNIRGDPYEGRLHRVPVGLVAAEGNGLEVEVTAFVVHSKPDVWRNLPPIFMGMTGCLERIRFAVDPEACRFYFGSVAESDRVP